MNKSTTQLVQEAAWLVAGTVEEFVVLVGPEVAKGMLEAMVRDLDDEIRRYETDGAGYDRTPLTGVLDGQAKREGEE